MVGPLILMKLLHCKRKRHPKPCKGHTENENLHDSKVKTEPNNEDYTCRVCLKDGGIPIFDVDHHIDLSEGLNLFGGIEVSIDDSFPKYLCASCHSLLRGAILLRKTAQQSEHTLKSNDSTLNYDHNYGSDDNFEYVLPEAQQPDYHCQRCNIGFESFKDYCEHRASVEHENTKIKCPVCNKLYSESYLKKHLLLHQPDVPFVCDICGKKFIIQGQFSRHRLTHFYNLPFQCSLCPYRGRFTESLKMHMRTHTGDRPYQCSECAKCFINKSNLNKHMLTHKGHEFECETCGRGFKIKRNLDLHYKVDHTGIKDHVCNVCGKAFGYRKQMMKHQLKVHKREKLRTGRLPLYLQVESKQRDGQDVLIADAVTLNKSE